MMLTAGMLRRTLTPLGTLYRPGNALTQGQAVSRWLGLPSVAYESFRALGT